MYIEVIIVIIVIVVIYLCLNKKKEKFLGENNPWFNAKIFNSDTGKLYDAKTATDIISKKDNYYTDSNMNPSAEKENKDLGKKKCFIMKKIATIQDIIQKIKENFFIMDLMKKKRKFI